jgi:hypothetical protein
VDAPPSLRQGHPDQRPLRRGHSLEMIHRE